MLGILTRVFGMFEDLIATNKKLPDIFLFFFQEWPRYACLKILFLIQRITQIWELAQVDTGHTQPHTTPLKSIWLKSEIVCLCHLLCQRWFSTKHFEYSGDILHFTIYKEFSRDEDYVSILRSCMLNFRVCTFVKICPILPFSGVFLLYNLKLFNLKSLEYGVNHVKI